MLTRSWALIWCTDIEFLFFSPIDDFVWERGIACPYVGGISIPRTADRRQRWIFTSSCLLHPAMSLTCKLLTIPIPKAMMLNGTSGLRVHWRLAAKLGKKIEWIFDFIVIIVTKHPLAEQRRHSY
jgi:hypothetical protein